MGCLPPPMAQRLSKAAGDPHASARAAHLISLPHSNSAPIMPMAPHDKVPGKSAESSSPSHLDQLIMRPVLAPVEQSCYSGDSCWMCDWSSACSERQETASSLWTDTFIAVNLAACFPAEAGVRSAALNLSSLCNPQAAIQCGIHHSNMVTPLSFPRYPAFASK